MYVSSKDSFRAQRNLKLGFLQTENSKTDQKTMYIIHLPLAVFSFSVKLSTCSLALVSSASTILHYSHLCTLFFKKM